MKERLTLAALPMQEAISSRLDPPRAYARNGWFALVWKLGAPRNLPISVERLVTAP
jgi:hypothetical protein